MSRGAGYLLRLALSLTFLAILIWVVDAPEAYERLLAMDPRWIAVAVACFTLVTVLMAWRWQITARELGVSFGLFWAVREYYLSQLVNLCLPGGVLGDAGRAIRTPRGEGGLTRAAHAVMIERLVGQIGILLVALGGVAYALMPGGIAWPDWLVRWLIWAVLAVCIVAGLLAVLLKRQGPLLRFGASLKAAVLSGRVILWQLGLTLVIALLMIAAFAACARATGTTLEVEAALILAPLILTTMMIPVSVGGWGLREGAAAVLFPIIGASASAGVAAGAAYGIALMIACLPGLALIPLLARARDTAAGDLPEVDPAVR